VKHQTRALVCCTKCFSQQLIRKLILTIFTQNIKHTEWPVYSITDDKKKKQKKT